MVSLKACATFLWKQCIILCTVHILQSVLTPPCFCSARSPAGSLLEEADGLRKVDLLGKINVIIFQSEVSKLIPCSITTEGRTCSVQHIGLLLTVGGSGGRAETTLITEGAKKRNVSVRLLHKCGDDVSERRPR